MTETAAARQGARPECPECGEKRAAHTIVSVCPGDSHVEHIAEAVEAARLHVLAGDEAGRLYDAYRFGDDAVSLERVVEDIATRVVEDAVRIIRETRSVRSVRGDALDTTT